MFVVTLISKVFKCLSKFSKFAGRIKHSIFENTTEPQRSTSSKAVQDRLRPDTIVVMNQCTLLLGKDKVGDIKIAMKDLERKGQPLHALHYGDVRFLLAYAAAGTDFQWLWMSSDGRLVSTLCPGSKHILVTVISSMTDILLQDVFSVQKLLAFLKPLKQPPVPAFCVSAQCRSCQETYSLAYCVSVVLAMPAAALICCMLEVQVKQLGRLFNLSQELDRLELVLCLVRAYYLMVVMARSVPEVIGRLPPYGTINRGSWGHVESRYVAIACWHAVLVLTCNADLA